MDKEKIIKDFFKFLNSAKSHFHVNDKLKELFQNASFCELKEFNKWQLEKQKKYFLTRADSAIMGVYIPKEIKKIHLITSHLDSPSMKLKPEWANKDNHCIWKVEPYGGTYNSTWFNRDLSIAGQVQFYNKNKELKNALIDVNDKTFTIPHLAIHLDRDGQGQQLTINKAKHLNPIIGLEDVNNKHSIQDFLKEYIQGDVEEVLSFDLFLYDKVAATLGGREKEFIYGPKLDNLAMAYSSFSAFTQLESFTDDTLVVVLSFNHEEVGSVSQTGANSQLLAHWLERLCLELGYFRESFLQILSQSYNISADMAHAWHPNYPEKYDESLYCKLNAGVAIKSNANQRYASTAQNIAYIIDLCKRNNIDYQWFINRSDIPCGSTIGPALSSQLALNTIDLGGAMLSMHSIREMMGTKDYTDCVYLFKEFLQS